MRRAFLPFVFLLLIVAVPAAQAVQLPGPLVETDWLAANRDKVAILDVRSDVKSFAAKPVFKVDKKTGKRSLVRVGGHIPGAGLVNYKKARASKPFKGQKLVGMLPEREAFAALVQAAGINGDSAVVIVTKGLSAGDMTMATRIYWQMKYYGHDAVAILNGGLAQWLTEGREVASGASTPAKGDWTPKAERAELLASSEEVAKASTEGSATLVDARPLDLYLGVHKKSYVLAKGHIPKAKVFPTSLMTRAGGPVKFLEKPELTTIMSELKVKTGGPAITYCNSGHLASGAWFVMHELLGNKDVKLYDGSMNQWTVEKRPTTKFKLE